MSPSNESLPQLHMLHMLDDLPELLVPEGYRLRSFGPDDAPAWVDLLTDNGELGVWTVERAAPYFAPGSTMPLDGAFFVVHGDLTVATAQLHLHVNDHYAPTPELGWVAVRPAHRGRRLGAVVCLAVLRHAAASGHASIFLRTDDHRLAAIRTYLRLGFRPWLTEPGLADRWRAILGPAFDTLEDWDRYLPRR